jgi:transposase
MAKLSAENKLAAVQRYVNGKESARAVATAFGISHRYLLSLVKQYEQNAVEAFARRYTNYKKAFKLDVLNYMADHGTSFNETTAFFNLAGASSIQNWKKQLDTQGEDAL